MLEVRRDHEVASIRLDHGQVNALDLELLEAFTAAITDLDADDEIGAIVVTGNGRAFSAGVDLKRILEGGGDYVDRFLVALTAAFLAPLRSATPVVAAVDGHAIAGGAVLAAACDRVIGAADDRIRIGLAELAVGVPFPPAAIEIMRRRLGPNLQEAVLTAENYSASQALEAGFLDRLVPPDQLSDVAYQAAAGLAGVPATTMELVKDQLRRPIETALEAHGEDGDARVLRAWSSDGIRSAIADFVARTLGDRAT